MGEVSLHRFYAQSLRCLNLISSPLFETKAMNIKGRPNFPKLCCSGNFSTEQKVRRLGTKEKVRWVGLLQRAATSSIQAFYRVPFDAMQWYRAHGTERKMPIGTVHSMPKYSV